MRTTELSGDVLTVTEVAKRLKANADTVRTLIKDGRLHPVRLGRRGGAVRVTLAELERFLRDETGKGEQ